MPGSFSGTSPQGHRAKFHRTERSRCCLSFRLPLINQGHKRLRSGKKRDLATESAICQAVSMDINDVIVAAPDALAELTRELVRRGDEEYKKDNESQLTACLLLAIRSASLLLGITRLIEPETHDGEEVLLRGFLEARDLLLTFRFDHKGTRTKVAYWFAGK